MENKQAQDLIPEIKLGDCTFLFLDVSSSCTGFTTAKIDFINKKASLTKAGAIWFHDKWEHARKYDYIYGLIQDHFWVVEQADHIITEQYSVNTKKMSGVLVSPEMHGTIQAAAYSNGVAVTSMLPQTWRSILQIKPDLIPVAGKAKPKRDYKTPTKKYVQSLATVPDMIKSNLTQKDKKTPSDVFDSMAIALAWLKKAGIKTIETKDCDYSGIGNY